MDYFDNLFVGLLDSSLININDNIKYIEIYNELKEVSPYYAIKLLDVLFEYTDIVSFVDKFNLDEAYIDDMDSKEFYVKEIDNDVITREDTDEYDEDIYDLESHDEAGYDTEIELDEDIFDVESDLDTINGEFVPNDASDETLDDMLEKLDGADQGNQEYLEESLYDEDEQTVQPDDIANFDEDTIEFDDLSDNSDDEELLDFEETYGNIQNNNEEFDDGLNLDDVSFDEVESDELDFEDIDLELDESIQNNKVTQVNTQKSQKTSSNTTKLNTGNLDNFRGFEEFDIGREEKPSSNITFKKKEVKQEKVFKDPIANKLYNFFK